MNSLANISVTVSLLCCSLFATLPTTAQVTADGTTSTTVNADGNNFTIEQGDQAGGNLFHSFRDFSVPSGGQASFNNAADVVNILSRVTGGNISNIDGLLRANGGANLFLINPAGIIFGQGARLDIGGSFYGSSANSILFEDGEFKTTNLDNPPVLTINAPIGLGFRDNPGNIVNNSVANDGRGLEVSKGSNVALIGGNVNFNGGIITAPSGKVELGGLTSEGTININNDGSFSFPDGIAKGDFSLTNGASVNVAADGGGFININANNLQLLDTSQILAGIAENVGSPSAQAGNIAINVNNLVARDDSQISNESRGVGNAGNVEIVTGNLDFAEGSVVTTSTFGQGNGGNVAINATGNVTFDRDFGGIYSQVGFSRDEQPTVETTVGNAGSVNVTANSFSLTNGARISTKTSGIGDAGDVTLKVADTVLIDGKGIFPIINNTTPVDSAILTQVAGNAVGKSGDIKINTGHLTLNDRTFLAADNFGIGDAGDITINASGTIRQTGGSIILTQIQDGAEGSGGDIRINTGNLILVDSLILSDSKGKGDAGRIFIKASEGISLEDTPKIPRGFIVDEGSLIISGVGILGDNTQGNAGNIEITTKSLALEGVSFILAQTNGTGNGGNIIIESQEPVLLNQSSRIVSQVQEKGIGNGGEIKITSPSISLDGFSGISTNTLTGGAGKAGNIILNTNNLRLTDASIIETLTENGFDGGNISINASTVDVTDGSKIITATNADGNAGNINLSISDRFEISGKDAIFTERLTQLVEDEAIRGDGSDRTNPVNDRFRFATPSSILKSLGNSSGLFANTTINSAGSGGNVQIGTPQEFSLSDTALISVGSKGQGGAGTLSIKTSSLTLDNSSLLASTPSAVGGNINLQIADTLKLNNQSLISAEATEDAGGGNINIDTNFIVAFPEGNNDILANAARGMGGNINITAESVFGIEERPLDDLTNDINASSKSNLDGTVSINILEPDAIRGTTELPLNIIEPKQTTEQACAVNQETGEKTNGLTVKGKGGVPPAPDLPLNSQTIMMDGKEIGTEINQSQYAEVKPIPTSRGDIIPAQGVIVTEDGRVILTAYRTDSDSRVPQGSANCKVKS